MLGSATVAFAQAGPELLALAIEALKQHPQPPRGRPAYTTGRTAAQLVETHGDDFVELSGPPHIQTLITGRGPTKSKTAGEPKLSEILAQWAEDKGIQLTGGLTYKQFGFLAARKMHDFGSELYHTGQPSGLFDKILSPDYLDLLKARIAAGEMVAITSALTGAIQGK